MAQLKPRMIDIGANLTDLMYTGVYHGSQTHEPDLDQVLSRAKSYGVERIMVTAGTLSEVQTALKLIEINDALTTTVGVHPTRCLEFDRCEGGSRKYLDDLILIAEEGKRKGKVVAIGEFGLDYDRLEFCPKEVQQKYFELQFELVERVKLPLFLHFRNCSDDFFEIVKRNRHRFGSGVVHSFDGSKEDLERLLALDLHIGINGCSLKTEENLHVAKLIPRDRLHIETDAPWCQIRNTHASSKFVHTKVPDVQPKKAKRGDVVKGRNEPLHLIQVLEVLAAVRGEPLLELGAAVFANSANLFFNGML